MCVGRILVINHTFTICKIFFYIQFLQEPVYINISFKLIKIIIGGKLKSQIQ